MNTRRWIGFIDKETASALTLLYSYMAFYEAISDEAYAEKANLVPQFWMAHTASLQHTLFIYLGRLSDDTPDGKSFTDFRNHCFRHLEDFSEESFRERRSDALVINPHYLDEKDFPEEKEFAALFSLASDFNKFLRKECKTIRSKVYAHAILTDDYEYQFLFEKVDLKTIEEALVTMWSINRNIWECFQNARPLKSTVLEYTERDRIYRQTRQVIEGVT